MALRGTVWVFAAVIGALPLACSLLAPSDGEAMSGLLGEDADATDRQAPLDGAPPETAPGDATADASEAGPRCFACGSSTCCGKACNAGHCASCGLAGAACAAPSDCCSGRCENLTCVPSASPCTVGGDDCATSGECCQGLTCNVREGTRCRTCRTNGNDCISDHDCCSMRCGPNKICASCVAVDGPCSSPTECCHGNCQNSVCVAP